MVGGGSGLKGNFFFAIQQQLVATAGVPNTIETCFVCGLGFRSYQTNVEQKVSHYPSVAKT